jgi:hypothetical protein
MNPEDFTNYIRLRNWKRNSELIDLSKIPAEIYQDVVMKFNKYVTPHMNLQYFIDNNIQELIDEFA